MILRSLLRILFVVFMIWFAVQLHSLVYPAPPDAEGSNNVVYLYALVALLFSTAVVVFEWRYQRQIVRELVAIIFGLAGGLAVSALLVLILIAFLMARGGTVDQSIIEYAFFQL